MGAVNLLQLRTGLPQCATLHAGCSFQVNACSHLHGAELLLSLTNSSYMCKLRLAVTSRFPERLDSGTAD